jgi:hypothetical protein
MVLVGAGLVGDPASVPRPTLRAPLRDGFASLDPAAASSLSPARGNRAGRTLRWTRGRPPGQGDQAAYTVLKA